MPVCKPLQAAAGMALVLFLTVPQPANATPEPRSSIVCQQAIAAAEELTKIPEHLLHAIGLVESGISTGTGRPRTPWPWTVMAQGKGRYFRNRADAVAEVRQLLNQGIYNIDVGCMQVNLRYHGLAFQSLEEAFDPIVNVAYAADFLRTLHKRHGSWDGAVKHYHSATPSRHTPYRAKVRAELLALKRTGAPMTPEAHAASTRSIAAAARRAPARQAPEAPASPQIAASNETASKPDQRSSGYLKLAQWPPQSYRSQKQAEFHARARVFYPPSEERKAAPE